MKEVINNTRQPVALQDGTVLAAAGTDGSTKQIASVSERDERLIRHRLISVHDLAIKAVAPAKPARVEKEREGAQE